MSTIATIRVLCETNPSLGSTIVNGLSPGQASSVASLP